MKPLKRVSELFCSRMGRRCLNIFMLGLTLWGATTLIAPSWAGAGLPVIDSAAITQMIQQYLVMAKQLVALYNQVDLLKQQVQTMTGHYGMGELGRQVNHWGGSTWADISDMVNHGVNPGDAAAVRAYQSARNRYQTQFPMLAEGMRTSNPRMNAAYNQTYSDAITGMGMGEAGFNQINETLADVQTLKDRIELTDNVKSALDLNSAINVRVAQINGEILRTQAAQLRLQAADKNNAASGNAAQTEFFAN